MRRTSRCVVAASAGTILIVACLLLFASLCSSPVVAGEIEAWLTTLESGPSPIQIARANTAVASRSAFSACSSSEMLIPLYSYPNWYDPESYIWDDVAAAASQISITAIINPGNGPGSCPPNIDYQRGISDLRDAGVTIQCF